MKRTQGCVPPVMAGLVPAIHAFTAAAAWKAWMAGTRQAMMGGLGGNCFLRAKRSNLPRETARGHAADYFVPLTMAALAAGSNHQNPTTLTYRLDQPMRQHACPVEEVVQRHRLVRIVA